MLKKTNITLTALLFSLITILTIGCDGGGSSGGDGSGSNDVSLKGTYTIFLNTSELIFTITETNTSCPINPGDQLRYEIISVTPTELILREDDDTDVYERISDEAGGIVGTWSRPDNPSEYTTINDDHTWYFVGSVKCSSRGDGTDYGSYEVNGSTEVATDPMVCMNFADPKNVQILLINNDVNPRDKLEITLVYNSKQELDNAFTNNMLTLNNDNIFYIGLDLDGSGTGFTRLNFSLNMIKNQDGTYDFSSTGSLVGIHEDLTVTNIIGEGVRFRGDINGY